VCLTAKQVGADRREIIVMAGVFQNIDPPPPSPRECVPPVFGAGGGHSLGGEGGGGSIFWKTPAIALASYNNLSTELIKLLKE